MADIYEQHKAAFARVAAFVVLYKGERVTTVAFKYPADGAGRLYAYVHWIGMPMVRGFAAGGGYDKATAACASAVSRMIPLPADYILRPPMQPGWGATEAREAFMHALALDRGPTWDSALREAGFTVLQAV